MSITVAENQSVQETIDVWLRERRAPPVLTIMTSSIVLNSQVATDGLIHLHRMTSPETQLIWISIGDAWILEDRRLGRLHYTYRSRIPWYGGTTTRKIDIDRQIDSHFKSYLRNLTICWWSQHLGRLSNKVLLHTWFYGPRNFRWLGPCDRRDSGTSTKFESTNFFSHLRETCAPSIVKIGLSKMGKFNFTQILEAIVISNPIDLWLQIVLSQETLHNWKKEKSTSINTFVLTSTAISIHII